MKDDHANPKLQDLGEEELVRRLVATLPQGRQVVVGPGDDCAAIAVSEGELLLLKTDAVVEGRHFLTDSEPARVGWKAAARVVSDFGAMGGEAKELLVTIAAAGTVSWSWVEELYRGITRCASQFGASVVGGETVSLAPGAATMVSVAGSGRVARERLVTRAGGQVGDCLWVTGRLGGSFASERHLDFIPRAVEGQWLAAHVHAMMDLSDGLQRDLPRLAQASGCQFLLEEGALPCHEGCTAEEALSDGEDMELLFAAPTGEWEKAFRVRFPEVKLTPVGRLVASGQSDFGSGGWQHFAKKGES